MIAKLSIIIPCYNSERTLEDTLKSVVNQEFKNWEAIIINDGSTDSTEEIALKWVEKNKRIKYYAKQNEGLCKTRNFGIAKSEGIYILPLDSDNLVMADFANDAIEILDNDIMIGVVHGNAEFIGDKRGIWEMGEFRIEKILQGNYIDACAIYRKEIWKQVGGYDENLPCNGLEDWELWLAFGAINIQFFHLKKITFKYRVSKNSMIGSFTTEMASITREYLAKKYSSLYCYHYNKFVSENIRLSSQLQNKKFVLNAFCKVFFGFSLFKNNN